MVPGLALAVLLVAGPEPVKIAALQLEGSGVPPELVESASLLVPTEVRRARPAAKVMAAEDVRSILTLQKNRAMLGGCGPDSGCLSDLGGVLGADEVVGGRVGALGTTYVLELRRVDVKKGQNLASATRAVSRAEGLVEAVRSATAELFGAAPAAGTATAAGAGTGLLPKVHSTRPDDDALPSPSASDDDLDFQPIGYRGTRHRAVYDLVRRVFAEAQVPVDLERIGDDDALRLRSAWVAIERGRRLRFRVRVDGRVGFEVDRERCPDTGCAETESVSKGERKLSVDLYQAIRRQVEKGG